MIISEKQRAIIAELQRIASDLRPYAGHKENVVYIAFAVSGAMTQYVLQNQHRWLTWSWVVALVANHIFIRTQLANRRRASAQRWACEKAVAYALTHQLKKGEMQITPRKEQPKWTFSAFASRVRRLFFPVETLNDDFLRQIETFQFYSDRIRAHIHDKQKRSGYFYLQSLLDGRPQGDEILTIASLCMITLAFLSALGCVSL